MGKKLKERDQHPRKSTIAVLSLVLLAVTVLSFGAIFSTRGEIRNHWVPRQVDRFYGPSVNATFDRVFNPLNPVIVPDMRIQKMGSRQGSSIRGTCYEGYFSWFSETVQCGVGAQGEVADSPAIEAQWNRNVPSLEAYLINHGWVRDREANGQTNLDQLFVERNTVRGITYNLPADKETCSIEFMYDNITNANPDPNSTFAEYTQSNTLSVYESCTRDVKFFGGDYEP
jgi:hypothetical protein